MITQKMLAKKVSVAFMSLQKAYGKGELTDGVKASYRVASAYIKVKREVCVWDKDV